MAVSIFHPTSQKTVNLWLGQRSASGGDKKEW